MTVAKQKKTVLDKKGSKKAQKEPLLDLSPLDTLIQKIDALEMEEQIAVLFEEEALLEKSLQVLLTLSGGSTTNDDDFECEKIDENVIEIMTNLLRDGLVEDEEFEEFFTDELEAEEEGDLSEDYEDEDLSDIDASESESIVSTVSREKEVKKASKTSKKSKHLRELEMLMEKVENESDLDDEEYETEDDESGNEDLDLENDSDSDLEKKDIFAEEKDDGRMSSFEKSQATLKTEIDAIESETLQSDRPWALRGEINARQRPSDSLLEEAVDFDSLARPTPQITEERTEEIEDVIKRRIEESAWDDVERKDGRDLTLLNGMAANTQKSARPLLEDVATAGPHRSLTQVYEADATAKLTGHSALDEETREKQTDLTALFAKICRHVDGLSGNRFAPKVYVQSDFQIKTLGKK